MDVVRLTEELIAIDSINPFECRPPGVEGNSDWIVEGNEFAIAEYLETLLLERNWQVQRQPVHRDSRGRILHNLLAERGTGDRSILYYGHMDTVTAKPWPSRERALTPERLSIDVHGERVEAITGLGASDMKGGIAAMVTALSDLQPADHRIKLALAVDEEFFSLGGNVLVESSFLDDVHACLVPEIDDGPNAGLGPSAISLGRLGRCELEISVPGTGGHGAEAGHGLLISAARNAARIVERIEALWDNFRDTFTFSVSAVPDVRAARSIEGSFYVSRIEAGDGTLSIPVYGTVRVSCSYTPSMTDRDVKAVFDNLMDEMVKDGSLQIPRRDGSLLPVSVVFASRPTPGGPAFATSEDHPFTSLVRDSVQRVAGFRACTMGYSVADENVIHRNRPGLPILNVCPRGGNFHREGEWVGVKSLHQLVEIYRDVGERFSEPG